MSILKLERFGKQKSAKTLLFIDFAFFSRFTTPVRVVREPSPLVSYAFVWETVKTMDFSETIVVYDIKVGRYSQLNEYIKPYEYQRSRSLTDLGAISHIQYF